MKFVFFMLFLVAPFFLFSQKFNIHSVVITKSNDSLHVFTANRQLTSPSFVKTWDSASGQYHSYKASEISELIVGNDDYYKSAIVTIDRTPYNEEISAAVFSPKQSIETVFLKTEYVSNNIKLYSLNDGKRTHFFIQKDNSPIEELIYRKLLLNRNGTVYENEDKKFILQLSDLLQDCPQAISGIDNISYTSQAIERVFNDYNRACHKGNIPRYSKTYKAKFEFSPLVGISSVTFSYKEDAVGGGTNKTKFSSGFSPIVGARFNYTPAILHYQLSITGDLYYSGRNASFSAYSNYINDSFYTRNTTRLKDQYINLGIVVRYYFLEEDKAVRPFVNIGYLAGFAVSSDNTVTTDDYFNAHHTITESDAYPNDGFKNYQFGYIAGIGVTYKKLSIDYRYSGYTNYLAYTSRSLTAISNTMAIAYRLNK